MGDHPAVQATLFDQVEAAEVGVRVTQPRPADQAFDLAVGEGGVGVVDGELDAFFEHHPEGEGVVLGFQGVDQAGGADLAELAFGLGIDPGHREPPA